MYMYNLYNNIKLCRDECAEKKLFHGVAMTHGRSAPEENIQQEAKSKKKTGQSAGKSKSGSDAG